MKENMHRIFQKDIIFTSLTWYNKILFKSSKIQLIIAILYLTLDVQHYKPYFNRNFKKINNLNFEIPCSDCKTLK